MSLNISLQKLDHYSIFVVCVYIIKFLFVFFAIYYAYLTFGKTDKENKENNNVVWAKLWKGRTEILFIFFMTLLLLYLFSPFHKKNVHLDDTHTRTLLFVYAIVIFITMDWNFFVHKSGIFDIVKK
jgi:hypothetical protein